MQSIFYVFLIRMAFRKKFIRVLSQTLTIFTSDIIVNNEFVIVSFLHEIRILLN